MKAMRVFRCIQCGSVAPHGILDSFCSCGGFFDVDYDLSRVVLRDSDDPCIRYGDLLPLEDPGQLVGPSHGPTRCLHLRTLGERWGLRHLYVKDETTLPTRTTKDRMGRLVVSVFKAHGVRDFTASSTGNSSTALAHWVSWAPEMSLHLFVGEAFLPYLQVSPEARNVHVWALLGATFVEAAEEARRHAEARGFMADRGFFNIARREGLKTAFLEAAEDLPEGIDWYVQAVSSAMGVYGAFKGAREMLALGRLEALPRLLCVQQASNAPMVRAFEEGHESFPSTHIVADPRGIARSILRGDPTRVYPHVRGIVTESGGTMAAVDEREILEAQQLLLELEGITCCATAAVALAGVGRLARMGQLEASAKILVNLTGRERPSGAPERTQWLVRQGAAWVPEQAPPTGGQP